MKNTFSRRTFLKASGVAAAAVMMGSLTGCRYDEKPVEVKPFNTELTAGGCKVTFLTVGGSGSATLKAPILVQAVTLRVENLGSDTVNLTKENFTVMMNDSRKLEISSCYELINGVPTGAKGTIPVEAGKATEIELWLAKDSQPNIEDENVKTITATATINGTTVSAIETKANFKYWLG